MNEDGMEKWRRRRKAWEQNEWKGGKMRNKIRN